MSATDSQFKNILALEFSTSKEQNIVHHTSPYLQYDQETSFVVDLDDVCKLTFIERKDVAKRLLLKHFIYDVDYQITTAPHTGNPGGSNKETIMLTPNSFIDFCTHQSEDGRIVRTCYKRMVALLAEHKRITYEDLYKKHKRLQEAEDARKEDERKVYEETGDMVYVWDSEFPNIYKVGSTDNLNSRAKSYKSCNIRGSFVYTKSCNNRRILESVVHHKLRAFKCMGREDWFELPLQVICDMVDGAQKYLDGDDAQACNLQLLPTGHCQSDTPRQLPATAAPNIIKFMSECCSINPSGSTIWLELIGRARTYFRMKNKELSGPLTKFLADNNYKKTDIWVEAESTTFNGYKGFTLNPLPPLSEPSNPPTEVDEFVHANFYRSDTSRVSTLVVKQAFVEWKAERDPNYTALRGTDWSLLKKYFSSMFFQSSIHDGERIRDGFYGVTLRGSKLEFAGRKSKPQNRKVVEQVDPNTSLVICEYMSVTSAGKKFGMDVGGMSTAISTGRLVSGFRFRLKEEEEE